jgi:hypothetical protein
MAGHWCIQCKVTQLQYSDNCELWTMDELMRCGEDAETKKGDPLLKVKKSHGGRSYLCNSTWSPSSTMKLG